MANSTELKSGLLRALWHDLTDVYHFVTHIRQIVILAGQIVAI